MNTITIAILLVALSLRPNTNYSTSQCLLSMELRRTKGKGVRTV